MLSKLLRPRLKMEIDERAYKFGESLNIRVSVESHSEIRLREGRIDLMCDVRHTESRKIMIPDRSSRTSVFQPRAMSGRTAPQVLIPKRISEEHHFRFPIGGKVFAKRGIITPGVCNFDVVMEITPYPPARAGDGGVTYELVASLDVIMGRDAIRKIPITVVLP